MRERLGPTALWGGCLVVGILSGLLLARADTGYGSTAIASTSSR